MGTYDNGVLVRFQSDALGGFSRALAAGEVQPLAVKGLGFSLHKVVLLHPDPQRGVRPPGSEDRRPSAIVDWEVCTVALEVYKFSSGFRKQLMEWLLEPIGAVQG